MEHLRDEVIAGQDLPAQVGVRTNAGVDHGHHHALAPVDVPGVRQVDASDGVGGVPLAREHRIVRSPLRMHDAVRLDGLDLRISAAHVLDQALERGRIQRPTQPHQVSARNAHGALVSDADAGTVRRHRHGSARGRIGAGAPRRAAQRDDQAVGTGVRVGSLECRRVGGRVSHEGRRADVLRLCGANAQQCRHRQRRHHGQMPNLADPRKRCGMRARRDRSEAISTTRCMNTFPHVCSKEKSGIHHDRTHPGRRMLMPG